MATIRKRGERWQVQVRRMGCPPQSGSFSTRSLAERWAREAEHNIELGELAPDIASLRKSTLGDLLKRYEREITPYKKGSDREVYKLKVIFGHRISQLSLARLSSSLIAEYRDERLKEVTSATVKRELALISHCLNIARKEWHFGALRNHVADVRSPKVQDARSRRLDNQEWKRFDDAIGRSKTWYIKPLVSVALETGMRRGELLALTWPNVDLLKRVAWLPSTKNGTGRFVPLSSKALAELSEMRHQQETVFPISPGAIRQTWERICASAAIDNFRFHDLRHEAITRLFEIGLTVPEVAAMSGHKDYKMLFRYTHLNAELISRKLNLNGA